MRVAAAKHAMCNSMAAGPYLGPPMCALCEAFNGYLCAGPTGSFTETRSA